MLKLPFRKKRTKTPIVDKVIPSHVECDEFTIVEFIVRGRHFTKETELHALGHARGHGTKYVSSEEIRGVCDVCGSEREPEFHIGLIVNNDPNSFSGGCSNVYPISATFTGRRTENPDKECEIPF